MNKSTQDNDTPTGRINNFNQEVTSNNLISANNNNLKFSKSFNFTKSKVFKAFTEEKYFQAWFGTLESKISYCKLDLQIGGNLILEMTTTKGKREFVGEYFEIKENEKLLFSLNATENGNIFYETLNTISFIELEPGKTHVTVNVEIIRADLEKGHFSMLGTRTGWIDGLEKLNKLLSTF